MSEDHHRKYVPGGTVVAFFTIETVAQRDGGEFPVGEVVIGSLSREYHLLTDFKGIEDNGRGPVPDDGLH